MKNMPDIRLNDRFCTPALNFNLNSRHPKCRCTKMVMKMNIEHTVSEFYIYMDFEGTQTNF